MLTEDWRATRVARISEHEHTWHRGRLGPNLSVNRGAQPGAAGEVEPVGLQFHGDAQVFFGRARQIPKFETVGANVKLTRGAGQHNAPRLLSQKQPEHLVQQGKATFDGSRIVEQSLMQTFQFWAACKLKPKLVVAKLSPATTSPQAIGQLQPPQPG
jgi:hypothetical protein